MKEKGTISDRQVLLKLAVRAALEAGEEILKVYETDFHVETKADRTPVTLADKNAANCISAILAPSRLPVINEELQISNYEERKNWSRVWIVDPLDGTKEYVKRNGEFTVNIALTENGKPVIGVIYSPVLKLLYFGCEGEGSFRIARNDTVIELNRKHLPENLFLYARRLPISKPPAVYTIVISRSHPEREVEERIKNLEALHGKVNRITVGSSLKQCLVAEGLAHEYPRLGATMEWDTAAGQCILEQAGGKLVDYETGKPMKYNKMDLRNGYFIAKGN
jgi:3'(2'), 5'-bisphosphate nucleotidase